MKKTLSINLAGRPFVIDEDAYDLLADYLHQLEIRSIAADEIATIEGRMADLFSATGSLIIDIQAVRDATARIGSPDQFGSPTGESPTAQPRPKRLYRSRTDRVIGGVCGGVAEYFGIDSLAVRLAFLVLLFFGGGAILYIIFWILVPEKPAILPDDRDEK